MDNISEETTVAFDAVNSFGKLTPQDAIKMRDSIQPGERIPIVNEYNSGELLIYERTTFKSSSYIYPEEWDTITIDESWFTESKSEKEYFIYTVNQLMSFRQMVNKGLSFEGVTINLRDDINLDRFNWQPIGTMSHPFKGIFNGNGHCVHNLNIGQIYENADDLENYGFFGCINSATICDIIFDNARVIDTRGGVTGVAIVAGTSINSSFKCIATSGLIMGNVFGAVSVFALNTDYDRCINRAKFYARSVADCSSYVCGGFSAFVSLIDYTCPEPQVYFPLFEKCINEGTIDFDVKSRSAEVSAGQLYGAFTGNNDLGDVKFTIGNCSVIKVNTAERKRLIPTYNGISGSFKQRLKYGCAFKGDLLDGYIGRTPCDVEILVTKAVLIKSDEDDGDRSTNIVALKSGHGNSGFITTHIFNTDTTNDKNAMDFLYPYYRFVTIIDSDIKQKEVG